MKFRPANLADVPDIILLIEQGKEYFRKLKIEQWQFQYPNSESIEKDIFDKTGYLLEETKIIAYVSASFLPEEHYHAIRGKWLSGEHDNFCTLHRLAIDNNKKGSGVAATLLSQIEHICNEKDVKNIRVDTHNDNNSMRRFLEKNGFTLCGIIINTIGEERLAYEKIL